MNIATILDMAADGLGDRVAMSAPPGSGRPGTTYAELRATARSAARSLTPTGGPAPALVFSGPTGPAVPVALFAAAYAGSTYTPLNSRLPAAALGALIGRVLPATAVVRAEDAEVARSAGASRVYEADAWPAAAGSAAPGEPDGLDAPDEPAAPAVLLFTSGTSGDPKAVRLHHDHLLAYILGTVEFAAAGEEESLLLAVPPFHIAGVSAVLSSVYSGRRIVPLPVFSAEAWLATAREERVTHAFVVPTMLARIVTAMEADPGLRVPTLRHLAYGGARMPLPVLERALGLFPGTGFVNAYGLTETSSTVAVLGPEDHRAAHRGEPRARRRLSSVGRVVPGVEARIVDAKGEPVAPGERGELRLRGAQIAGATADGDAWFTTGDEASMDADGYLYVHGRGDDTIIRGGENISPGEVEDALIRHPAIGAACVVGLPDPEWGERIEAVVVPAEGGVPVPGDVLSWLRERVGTLKTPQALHIVGELPVTATGKVIRRQVRATLGGA